jgi:predicted dehydrogenase
MIRLGYVGCGFMAQKIHIPNFTGIPECQLVALAELKPRLRDMVAERYGIAKRYASHEEMAEDPEIDAVAISGPKSIQGETAIPFLLKGKHVFVEKPLATLTETGNRVLAAAKKGGARIMTAYMYRHDPGLTLGREIARRGDIGDISLVRAHCFVGGDWLGGLDTPFDQTDEPSPSVESTCPEWLPESWHNTYNGFTNLYTHYINLSRWLCDAGGDVEVISSDLEQESTAGVVILRMKGIRVILEAGTMHRHSFMDESAIYGSHGYVRMRSGSILLRNHPAEVEVYRGKPINGAVGWSNPVPENAFGWSYREEAKTFIDCLINDKPFISPAEDSIHDVSTIEAIFKKQIEG